MSGHYSSRWRTVRVVRKEEPPWPLKSHVLVRYGPDEVGPGLLPLDPNHQVFALDGFHPRVKAGFLNEDTTLAMIIKCFELFSIAHKLTQTTQAIELATIRTIEEFLNDGVIYLELRSTLRHGADIDKRGYLKAMVDAVIEARNILPGIDVCILVSVNRSEPLSSAEENITVACEFAQLYPEVVVGLDLSGDPAKGNFNDFKETLNNVKSKLKLTLHFAEIQNDEEVTEIIKFKANRLGHGTFLSEENLDLLKRSQIPVEVCITSNVKCGTAASSAEHHFRILRSLGNPVILATDDKGVFDTCLSQEYALAMQHHNLTPKDCWVMNNDAVNFIFAPDKIKEKVKERLLIWWKENNESEV